MQIKSWLGLVFSMGTTFEVKLRLFREKNYKYVFGLLPFTAYSGLKAVHSSSALLKQFSSIGVSSSVSHFFLWKRRAILADIYAYLLSISRNFASLFGLFFVVQYVNMCVQYVVTYLIRINYTKRTKTQVMRPRETLFEIMKMAEEEGRSIVYLDFDTKAGEVVRELITRLYPQLNFTSYIHEPRSLSIQSQSGDFFVDHPHWYEAKQFLAQHKSDIILLAVRGSLEDELQAIYEFKKDNTVHFSSLIACDVSTFNVSHSLLHKLQTLHRLVAEHCLEQFIAAMDKRELWGFIVRLLIQHDTMSIVDDEGKYPEFVSQKSDGLEVSVLEALTDIVFDTRQVSVAGKVKRIKKSRILPSFEEMQRYRYRSARTIELTVPLVHTGSAQDIRPGYHLKEM